MMIRRWDVIVLLFVLSIVNSFRFVKRPLLRGSSTITRMMASSKNKDDTVIGHQQPNQYSVSFENPPFFPCTLEELASDVAFAAKVAIVSRMLRIRIDVRLRITSRGNRYMLKWLLLTAVNLFDDEFQHVHIFIDKTDDVLKCQEIWKELVANVTTPINGTDTATATAAVDYERFLEKIKISSISDLDLSEKATIFLIYNPDNIYNCEHENLLEEVQALCFHAALRKLPVLLINPTLMATAWNDFGARAPLLLSDFAQAYFICDDYFMFSRRDQWAGLVQRAASGFDLFLLEGFPSALRTGQQKFPTRYTRIQNWPTGYPHDLKSFVARLLGHDPNFPLKQILEENRLSEEKRLAHIPDLVLKEDLIDDVMSNGLKLQRRVDGDGSGSGGGSSKNGGSNGGSTGGTRGPRGPNKTRTRTSRTSSSSLIPSSFIEDGMDGNSWRNIKPATPSRNVKRQREKENT